jgi:hypothetical protein
MRGNELLRTDTESKRLIDYQILNLLKNYLALPAPNPLQLMRGPAKSRS